MSAHDQWFEVSFGSRTTVKVRGTLDDAIARARRYQRENADVHIARVTREEIPASSWDPRVDILKALP